MDSIRAENRAYPPADLVISGAPDPDDLAEALAGSQCGVLWHSQDIDGVGLAAAVAPAHLISIRSRCVDPQPEVTGRLLGAPGDVRVAVRAFPVVVRVTFARAEAMLHALAQDLGLELAALVPGRHALICFTDGGAGGEDLLVAALASAARGVPLVGGTGTMEGLALDGVPLPGGVVVLLIESPRPVHAFLVHPFTPTAQRTVVTEFDASGRRVRSLDGWPAVQRFIELAGVSQDALQGSPPEVLQRLSVQLGWMIAGQLVVRPVVGVDGDEIALGGAVEEGAVLRVLRREPDVPGTLRRRIQKEMASRREPAAGAWLFGCGGIVEGQRDELLADLDFDAVALPTSAQQFGPVHTCHAVSVLMWPSSG